MSTKKSEKNKKVSKENKSQEKEQVPTKDDTIPEVPLESTQDIRTIIINIDFYRNIVPLYPVSDIKANLKYLDKEIGESQTVPVTDDEKIEVNHSFEVPIDINSVRQIDQLASNPIFLTAIQSSGALDPTLYEHMRESQNAAKPLVEDIESLFSMYEAFTGEKADVRMSDMKKATKKAKKEKSVKDNGDNKSKKSINKSIISRGSKISKKSKGSKSSGDRESLGKEVSIIKSEAYGMCVIDLIPLFHGESSFTEKILLQPIKRSCHILSTYKNFPEVTITVALKDNGQFLDVKNILNFTVESICNVPSLILSDMDCKICVFLPLQNSASSAVIFHNPKITSKAPNGEVPKRWPCINDIGYNANTTKYCIDSSFENVKNKANIDLEESFKDEATRFEFNYLKRNVLFKSGNNELAAHIITHHKLVLEIYLTPKTKRHEKMYDAYSDSEGSEHPKQRLSKTVPYLHLMAVVDVVLLLYPGITKIRTAAPLFTFTLEEAAKYGLEDSFFSPKPKTDLSANRASRTKLDISKKKKNEKKEKPIKKEKESTIKEDKNLANQLPPQPEEVPPPEPSLPVYNEDGKPCFIIVEIELLKPIKPKRDIDELKADLYQMQMDALTSTKTVLNKEVASDFYRQTINEIVIDLNKNYLKYNENRTSIPQKEHGDFLEYLQKTGFYQTYLNSITTAATLVITKKYKCHENDIKNSKTYQNLISEVFSDLISEMHNVLNSLVCNGMKPCIETFNVSRDEVFFYAKEAAELRLYPLANRYFLERITFDKEANPDYWLDYALFQMELGDTDKAFECIKEAIGENCNHKYSLLLFGALLTEKEKIQEAETCFLNIMVNEPKWAVGWCVLYLFYEKCSRPDGMEMALDMGKKIFDQPTAGDFFSNFEDLSWSSKNIPNTLFFNTAVTLLKLRLYSWVEVALAQEVTTPKYYGFVNYLLAVISYYRRSYEHALEHVEEAKEYQGGDFAILGISGHSLFAQGKLEEARDEYYHIIESYDRPEDIHLVYLNCAQVLATLGDDQEARKLLLIACKNHQTPYVWFTIGKLYFKQNDLLSAEESLSEANKRDNRNAGVWGYLTLVNLKLNRPHEAQQCYEQAVKFKLDDEEMIKSIQEEFIKISHNV